MIFKLVLAILILLQASKVFAFDVCESNSFKKTEIGWIRTVTINKNIFIDFKVNKDDLEQDGLNVSRDFGAVLAKDLASNAYYRFYTLVSPPPFSNADLIYSNSQLYIGDCWSKRVYGVRTPLNTFNWSRSDSDADMLPAVRGFLQKKQLIN